MAAASAASVWIVGPPGSGRQRPAEAIHYGTGGTVGSLIPLDCRRAQRRAGDVDRTGASPRGGRRRKGPPAARSCWPTSIFCLPTYRPAWPRPSAGAGFPLRLIATARQPPEELFGPGKFRQDLGLVAFDDLRSGFRLWPSGVKTCRWSRNCFWKRSTRGEENNSRVSPPEALDALHAYPWPGNLDELAAMVAMAHQRAEGRRSRWPTCPRKSILRRPPRPGLASPRKRSCWTSFSPGVVQS